MMQIEENIVQFKQIKEKITEILAEVSWLCNYQYYNQLVSYMSMFKLMPFTAISIAFFYLYVGKRSSTVRWSCQ